MTLRHSKEATFQVAVTESADGDARADGSGEAWRGEAF
jgi:hypothetical protein